MSKNFPPDRSADKEVVLSLSELPLDMKRILSIQFREFIHHIEDAEDENTMEHNPRVIHFLERCLKVA